jgi:adhesin transport system membrane fusion protein
MLMNTSPKDTTPRQPAGASLEPGNAESVRGSQRTVGQGFARDAQIALEEQAPRGGTLIIYLALLLIVGFGVWASVTQIDEVARGEGRIVPAGSVHVVHSMDGGVVERILVKEGERVAQGQPLVHIEAVRADAALGETRSRRGTLTARFERLRAEASGQNLPRFSENEAAADLMAVAREKQVFEARRLEFSAQLQVVDGQLEQRRAEAEETSRRRDATIAALALLQREYDVSKPLSRTGAVSEFDMVRLER